MQSPRSAPLTVNLAPRHRCMVCDQLRCAPARRGGPALQLLQRLRPPRRRSPLLHPSYLPLPFRHWSQPLVLDSVWAAQVVRRGVSSSCCMRRRLQRCCPTALGRRGWSRARAALGVWAAAAVCRLTGAVWERLQQPRVAPIVSCFEVFCHRQAAGNVDARTQWVPSAHHRCCRLLVGMRGSCSRSHAFVFYVRPPPAVPSAFGFSIYLPLHAPHFISSQLTAPLIACRAPRLQPLLPVSTYRPQLLPASSVPRSH